MRDRLPEPHRDLAFRGPQYSARDFVTLREKKVDSPRIIWLPIRAPDSVAAARQRYLKDHRSFKFSIDFSDGIRAVKHESFPYVRMSNIFTRRYCRYSSICQTLSFRHSRANTTLHYPWANIVSSQRQRSLTLEECTHRREETNSSSKYKSQRKATGRMAKM